ncbi:hypothetical protein IY145_18715 [Methylosinus sp. H3A]|uniref:hypothetical protein n=1 Tax=Methylosinus sp. H3A TaxID=2785786 RepID=UPI0018C32A33|nr:hypothetical protein [Methylosinus sp. H3A]MBG0811386.1 hypothetical protein [Methylosinus sp. H3A]
MTEEKTFTRERPKTVGELIEALQKLPAAARVMVHGEEDSLYDCGSPMIELAMLNRYPDSKDHLGPHRLSSGMDADKAVGVVIIKDAIREF